MPIKRETGKSAKSKQGAERRDFIQDSKDIKHGFWTKPRPWAFVLLASLEILNVTAGPEFWFHLGVTYKDRGWTEAARICLQLSSFANPWNEWSKRADAFKKARLPANNISPEAQEKNIDAYNLDASGRTDKAVVAFEVLIKEYPNFEWPYNNLASIMVERGDYEKGRLLSSKALEINPYYANAHSTLADALQNLGQQDAASKHRSEAYSLVKECGEY